MFYSVLKEGMKLSSRTVIVLRFDRLAGLGNNGVACRSAVDDAGLGGEVLTGFERDGNGDAGSGGLRELDELTVDFLSFFLQLTVKVLEG